MSGADTKERLAVCLLRQWHLTQKQYLTPWDQNLLAEI